MKEGKREIGKNNEINKEYGENLEGKTQCHRTLKKEILINGDRPGLEPVSSN
jgi:hypothetical protein